MIDSQTLIYVGAALLLGALLLRRSSRGSRMGARIHLGSISDQWLMDRKYLLYDE
jgi:hypothetical protein